MIEILVDDHIFIVSLQTLEKNPDFIITQIINGTIQFDSCPLVEKINDKIFKIDIDPDLFASIIKNLRNATSINYISFVNSMLFPQIKNLNIFHKPQKKYMNNTTNFSPFDKVIYNPITTENHNILNTDTFINLSKNSEIDDISNTNKESVNDQFNFLHINYPNDNNTTEENFLDSLDSCTLSNLNNDIININSCSQSQSQYKHILKPRKIELNTSEDHTLNTKYHLNIIK